jgi:steroid delta-isomerase-like uncharacterized protein
MTTDVKETSRRIFEEVWNDKKVDVANELMTPDYVHHDPQSIIPTGIDGYKKLVSYYLNAFPDLRFTIEDEISEGDMVVTRWTATGTHQGDLNEIPPTGKAFSVTGITMARVINGRIIESWNNWDTLGLMQQLGHTADVRSRAA